MQMYSEGVEGEKQLFLHFAKNLISDWDFLILPLCLLYNVNTVIHIYLKRNGDLTHWCQEVEDADQASLGRWYIYTSNIVFH